MLFDIFICTFFIYLIFLFLVSRTFPEDRLPDLEKEARYIRTFNEIDELFEFIHFDSTTHIADLGEGVQIVDHGDEYPFYIRYFIDLYFI